MSHADKRRLALSKLLDTRQAAEFLGMAPDTLTIWRCTGRVQLPYMKIGGSVRYTEEDLLAFVESRKVHPVAV
jgi:predicted DNA-binding transcriptional regulator AlpA